MEPVEEYLPTSTNATYTQNHPARISRSPHVQKYRKTVPKENKNSISSDPSTRRAIVLSENYEGQDLKLPDIHLTNGHSIDFNFALQSNDDRNTAMRKSHKHNTSDIENKITNPPLTDNSNTYNSIHPDSNKQNLAVVRPTIPKGHRKLRYTRFGSPPQRPFYRNVKGANRDVNNKLSLPPVGAAIRKRWVSSTRPLSHSEDRLFYQKFPSKLHTSPHSVSSVDSNLAEKRKASDEEYDDNEAKDIKMNLKREHGKYSKTSKEERIAQKKFLDFLNTDIIGNDAPLTTSFGKVKVTYLDYIASGRPLRSIESYMRKHVMPFYANTHTTVSYTGMQSTVFREEARGIIRKSVNASVDDYVIFTGSGATSAENKLIHALNIGQNCEEDVYVFLGPFEHHSNILPWTNTKAKVTRILQNSDGEIDVQSLVKHLESVHSDPQRAKHSRPIIIGAFSAASNVTGILSPVREISSIMHQYNGYVIWDYACAGPYARIDMNPVNQDEKDSYIDGLVISPHKFVGGPGTPGILIAKKWMFRNPTPHNVGGGTVLFVRRTHHLYFPNPEHSEEGGTPAILESIRAGLVFKLKDAISPEFIMKKEEAIMKKAVTYLKEVPGVVILGSTHVQRLAILPFMFYQEDLGRLMHYDFMAMLFNDLFGIQVRSGCACAAPYTLDLMGLSEDTAARYEGFVADVPNSQSISGKQLYRSIVYKPGFVRFSLPYFITPECLDFVLAAIHMTAVNGWAMLPQYKYNRNTGEWSPRFKRAHTTLNTNHLSDVEFKSGSMKVTTPGERDKDSSESISDSTSSSNKTAVDYDAILYKAESLFRDALAGAYDCPEESEEERGEWQEEEEDLRWFVKPVEAANLIHGRHVDYVDPKDLPFMPGALASKIKFNPKGHRGRSQSMDKDFIMEYYPDQ